MIGVYHRGLLQIPAILANSGKLSFVAFVVQVFGFRFRRLRAMSAITAIGKVLPFPITGSSDLRSPTQPFFTFCCKQTYLCKSMLGWPLRGPWETPG
jgi:hypothetical protein